MIPRLVHYIWVGGHALPEKNRHLLAASERFLPGYTIKLWTEADLDLSAPFVQRAYAEKRWAFVSDYLRFVILRDQGGIYLDTDMELLRPIDDLLDAPAFSGFNRAGDMVYCGMIGAVPGHPLFTQLVKDYDALPPGQWPTSPQMMTATWHKMPQDIVIHPFSAFYPVDEGKRPDPTLLAQAYATHHWDESWRSFVPLRRILRRLGIIPLYHKLALKRHKP